MASAILILIISLIGLILSLKKDGYFQKIITVGLVISVSIIWVGDRNSLLASVLLQLGLAFLSVIYAIIAKGVKIIDRIVIAIVGLILTFGTLAIIQHYPGQKELRIALIIPMALFLWTTIKHGRYQPKEFGFTLIWIVIAAVQFVNYLIV